LPNLEAASPEEVLSWALSTYGDSLAISTSFQKEGMVVIDMATRIDPKVRVFTIDTGRLPEETLISAVPCAQAPVANACTLKK